MATKKTAKPASAAQPATTSQPSPSFDWAVPPELDLPKDQLRVRVDYYHQATTITEFDGDFTTTRLVDAADITHALAEELSYGTGLLPENALWWRNGRSGPVTALYIPPGMHKVALSQGPGQPTKRFNLPMPGLVFLCVPGHEPWVYAVKKRPTKGTDPVFRAPLANVFESGRTCIGTHKYPDRIEDIPESFFVSWFSAAANLQQRSHKFPENIVHMWEFVNNKKQYPLEDLVQHGTVKDLMVMGMES